MIYKFKKKIHILRNKIQQNYHFMRSHCCVCLHKQFFIIKYWIQFIIFYLYMPFPCYAIRLQLFPFFGTYNSYLYFFKIFLTSSIFMHTQRCIKFNKNLNIFFELIEWLIHLMYSFKIICIHLKFSTKS